MQLQPSTQSWRVIWRARGQRAQIGERKRERPLDQAADFSLQSAKFAASAPDSRDRRARSSRWVGNRRDVSARYSRASAWRGASSARWRSASAPPPFPGRRARPASAREVAAGERQRAGAGDQPQQGLAAAELVSASWLLLDAVAAGDHRRDVVDRARTARPSRDGRGRKRPGSSARMKWMVRADWRPPNRSSSQGKAASTPATWSARRGSAAETRRSRPDRRASAARCSAAPLRPWESAAARDRRSARHAARSRALGHRSTNAAAQQQVAEIDQRR